MTEESKLAKAAREAGAQTATPAQLHPDEVPSRAAQVNGEFSLREKISGVSEENSKKIFAEKYSLVV